MKRLARCSAALVVVALGLPRATAVAQEAAPVEVQAVGWWSSRPTAVAQPEQGFEVAAGPQGDPQSVAAIRLSVAAAQVDTLEVQLLESAGGSIGTEFGTIQVCTTADAWSPANPGAMADAPTADCSSSALLTRTTEGTWLGDLARLVPDGGQVSLMLLPKYQPPVPVGPGMVVTIASGSFSATGSSTTTTGVVTGTDDGSGSVGGSFDTGGSFGDVGYDPGSFGDGSFVVPPAPPLDDGATTTSVPVDRGTDEPSDDFALPPVSSPGDGGPPWVRLLVLVPLCVGFGLGSVRVRRLLAARGVVPAAT